MTGKQGTDEHPGRKQTNIPSPHIPPPGRYMVVLDQFHIGKTRAQHNDTDYVTLTVQVNHQPSLNQTVFVGEVNDGDHPVNLQLGPVDVGTNDTLAINYVVLNKGHSNGDVEKVKQALAAAVSAAIVAEFPSAAKFGAAIAEAVSRLVAFIDPDCDGNCAAQQFKFSGAQLEQRSSGTGSFGETIHDEIVSQDGCGGSGQYDVTWHIPRVDRPSIFDEVSVFGVNPSK